MDEQADQQADKQTDKIIDKQTNTQFNEQTHIQDCSEVSVDSIPEDVFMFWWESLQEAMVAFLAVLAAPAVFCMDQPAAQGQKCKTLYVGILTSALKLTLRRIVFVTWTPVCRSQTCKF